MPRIYVEFSGLDRIGSRCKIVASKVVRIQLDLQHTIRQLDWDVRYESNINNISDQIIRKLKQYSSVLVTYQQFIEDARDEYIKLNEYTNPKITDSIRGIPIPSDGFSTVEPNRYQSIDWNKIFKRIVITKPYILPSMLTVISPITGLLYITSGVYSGKTPSFLDYSRKPSSGTTADWLGYKLSDRYPKVTAWLGKAGAEAQNEWGYASVNAYLGKAEAEAKSDFAFMKKNIKTEYKNGNWVEKATTTFLVAESIAGGSVSVLSADVNAGIGSDMFGIEGKAEGMIGNATAKTKGVFSVGEEGVNVYAKGKAMVSAVEGKADGTINILGLEITGKVGGYAGALGVEGKVGVENNKFVLQGGAAALIGGSVGVEIGLNDEGWNNFVDFISFWD